MTFIFGESTLVVLTTGRDVRLAAGEEGDRVGVVYVDAVSSESSTLPDSTVVVEDEAKKLELIACKASQII